MNDKTGKSIEVGQVVDVFISDIVSAYVVEVKDGGLAGADGRVEPASLILNVALPMVLRPGQPAPVYIVRESDKPKHGPTKEQVM